MIHSESSHTSPCMKVEMKSFWVFRLKHISHSLSTPVLSPPHVKKVLSYEIADYFRLVPSARLYLAVADTFPFPCHALQLFTQLK